MTQPKYAPIPIEDEVRPLLKTGVPRPWSPHRPGERRPGPSAPMRRQGAPGPDQGYALALAQRLADRLVLAPGEHRDDVLAAAVAIALKRAAVFGRAPVIGDLELALGALGSLEPASEAHAARRRRLVQGAAHDDARQRAIADRCPPDALSASSSALAEALFATDAPAA